MRGHRRHAISGAFDECAQECAHAGRSIGMHHVAELVVHYWLTGKATVFQTLRHCEIAFTRNICRIRKCLRRVYLQGYGEVAERLKAAVC